MPTFRGGDISSGGRMDGWFNPLRSAAIHSAADGLYRAGAVDEATMRGFAESCMATPLSIAPKQIERICEQAHVSQPVFARYLNTSESTVQKWEAGTKRPSGTALKLLAVVEKHGLKVLA